VSRYGATKPFESALHQVDAFRCGDQRLDTWLRAYASQNERRDAARTFVTATDVGDVVGYYTLVASQVAHVEATEAVRKRMAPRFPIPVALIARLAVHINHQGAGLGRSLLLDALRRVLSASSELAVRAVLVHAIDEKAVRFYSHFGFEPSTFDDLTMMVTLSRVRDALT
jgi:predicted N-acetyltransferase YhbS